MTSFRIPASPAPNTARVDDQQQANSAPRQRSMAELPAPGAQPRRNRKNEGAGRFNQMRQNLNQAKLDDFLRQGFNSAGSYGGPHGNAGTWKLEQPVRHDAIANFMKNNPGASASACLQHLNDTGQLSFSYIPNGYSEPRPGFPPAARGDIVNLLTMHVGVAMETFSKLTARAPAQPTTPAVAPHAHAQPSCPPQQHSAPPQWNAQPRPQAHVQQPYPPQQYSAPLPYGYPPQQPHTPPPHQWHAPPQHQAPAQHPPQWHAQQPSQWGGSQQLHHHAPSGIGTSRMDELRQERMDKFLSEGFSSSGRYGGDGRRSGRWEVATVSNRDIAKFIQQNPGADATDCFNHLSTSGKFDVSYVPQGFTASFQGVPPGGKDQIVDTLINAIKQRMDEYKSI